MHWYALFFSLLILPCTNAYTMESGPSGVVPSEEERMRLVHFPDEVVGRDTYSNFSTLVSILVHSSGRNFLNGCAVLKKRLETRSRLLSDIFITTIHDLITRERTRELTKLQHLLIILNRDEHIFRALYSLPEEAVVTLLHNNRAVRAWWDASIGKEWQRSKNLRCKSAVEFAEEFLQLHKRVNGEMQPAIVSRLTQLLEKKDLEGINEIKGECTNFAHERAFRQSLHLPQELVFTAYGAGLFYSEKYMDTNDPEWRKKFEHEAELKEFVSRIDGLLSQQDSTPQQSAAQESIQVAIPVQLQPHKDTSTTAGQNTTDQVDEQKKTPEIMVNIRRGITDLRAWLGACGISVVTVFYAFYRIKELERWMQQDQRWMNWKYQSSADLKNFSARSLVEILSYDILQRRHAKRLFDSNEKILLDFLTEVEQEVAMITAYATRSNFIKKVGLGSLFCLDPDMAHKAEEGLLRLQIIKQKVLEYILEMKMAHNVHVRKVAF